MDSDVCINDVLPNEILTEILERLPAPHCANATCHLWHRLLERQEIDDTICEQAAADGNLELLNWARENDYPWKQTYIHAARSGNLNVVKWVEENGCPWYSHAYTAAAEVGAIDVLEHFWGVDEAEHNHCGATSRQIGVRFEERPNDVPYFPIRRILIGAAKCNRIEVLDWVLKRFPAWKHTRVCDRKYMDRDDEEILCDNGKKAFKHAAYHGNLTMMQKLKDVYGFPLSDIYDNINSCNHIIKAAVIEGNVNILEWILKDNIPDSEDVRTECFYRISVTAAVHSQLDVLKWLHTKKIRLTGEEYMFAITNERKDIFEWLLSVDCPKTKHAVMAAAQLGNIEHLKALVEMGFDFEEVGVMESAAKVGHMHVILWIIDQEKVATIPLSQYEFILWTLCECGYIEILKLMFDKLPRLVSIYLVENMREHWVPRCHWREFTGDTPIVCDELIGFAAYGGQLNVVQFLMEIRDEWYTRKRVFKNATRSGQVHILEWMLNEKGYWNDKICSKAIQWDHFNIVKWIHDNKLSAETNKLCNVAKFYGRHDIFIWLRSRDYPYTPMPDNHPGNLMI